jgi:hypothetical protein
MWLRYLSQRLGIENTLSLWNSTFDDYDDTLLVNILSSEWREVITDESIKVEDQIQELVDEFYPPTNPLFSSAEARTIIENTPPINQIMGIFAYDTMEREISSYDALHLRFDCLASIAETLIDKYGKQGELIAYDLMVEGRLAAGSGETGSVEEFIEYITAEPDTNDIFTAGLEIEVISVAPREAITHIHECEWARYFQDHHPQVGYLMACSTDEVAYKAFNKDLILQRTQTIMEGGEYCDFRTYAPDETLKTAD